MNIKRILKEKSNSRNLKNLLQESYEEYFLIANVNKVSGGVQGTRVMSHIDPESLNAVMGEMIKKDNALKAVILALAERIMDENPEIKEAMLKKILEMRN